MKSIVAYTKFELVQAFRIPVVYVALLFLPSVGMLLFVLPLLGDDPEAAVLGTASMCLFAVLIICSAQYAIGIADSRTKPWGGYVRTLPGGPLPRMVSLMVESVVLVVAGSLPLLAIAAIGTEARASLGQILVGLLALSLGVVPFGLMMLAIGYAVAPQAVGVLTSIAPITLAFLGGYFTDPAVSTGLIATIAPFVPTRGPAEVVWAAVTDHSPDPLALAMFPVWTVLFGVLAWYAYRRDESRRFR
jgi:ABC-2 type transport system permease protein